MCYPLGSTDKYTEREYKQINQRNSAYQIIFLGWKPGSSKANVSFATDFAGATNSPFMCFSTSEKW